MQTKTGKPSVMVVEDDDELRDRILVPGLRKEGFDAEGAESAMALYRKLSLRSYDMFVVDIGLPDESGFDVLNHLRKLGDVGIVLLTGRSGAEDRVQGLDSGADAYLSKPVGVNVLAATLRSVLRRLGPVATPAEPVPPPAPSGWRLEQQGWQLLSPSGTQVTLSKGERLLLTLLAESAGTAVERETIIGHLCGNDYDFDPHRLEMLVHRLRRKVQLVAGEELPLVTVRGVGHLFLP
ncbi:response regulator transcription factor [Luteimonas sp. e5]